MTEMKKILCAIDLSEGSSKVVGAAAGITQALGAELRLIHIFDHPLYNLPTGFNPPAGYSAALLEADKGIRQHLEERLKEQLDSLEGSDFKVDCRLAEGPAAQQIVEYAREEKYELIIMGTHGYSGLKHALLGSVAERVVRTSEVPVLIIPTRE